MYTILWLSRHIPQEAQIIELQNKFGKIDVVEKSLVFSNNPNDGAEQIIELMQNIGADDIVGVMPIAHVAALTKRGVHPIRAIMDRKPTGAILPNGEKEYQFEFIKFERITGVQITSESL